MRPPLNLTFSGFGLLVVLSLVLQAACGVASVDLPVGQEEVQSNALDGTPPKLSPRRHFIVPKVMRFSQFKAAFKRRYHSIREELVKCRLFLARSFKTLVSAVAYKLGRAKFYTAINERSDWTGQELEASRNMHLASFFSQEGNHDEVDREVVNASPADGLQCQQVQGVMNSSAETMARKFEHISACDEWPAALCKTTTWPIEEEPNYRRIMLRELIEGRERHYGHLPVKGNFRLLSGAQSEKSVLDLWDQSWFGRPSADKRRPAEQDIVWVDHRRSQCLHPVGDQGDCGSCYAFASISFLEWAHCRETGKKEKFSEQYLVDCGNGTPELYGCDGGTPVYAGEFTLNFGLELARHFPYKGKESSCPYVDGTNQTMLFKHAGSKRVNLTHISIIPIELFEEYLQFAPILVTLTVFKEFDEFGGGVYDGRNCRGDSASHSVLLIGHGREDGEEYWLLRNSFGPNWGEQGHMKLNKNSECFDPEFGFILGSRNGKHVHLQSEEGS